MLKTGGKSVTYRAIPPKAWVKKPGAAWVVVSGKLPVVSPLAGLAESTATAVVSDAADQLVLDVTYPPSALGLSGWAVPQRPGRMGRPRTKARPGPNTAPAQAVRDVVRALPPDAWIRHRVTEGEKGPREYEFARLRVTEKVHRAPGQAGWLLARRPVGSDQGAEIKCYLSNAPATIALAEMAAVGCLRWTIEEDFELAKGEVGLDQYEVTKYRGWYHHITLSLLALAFLKAVQREWGEKWGPRIGAGSPPAA